MALPVVFRHLTRDGWLLFVTRFVRLFAYGSLSIVLVFYLKIAPSMPGAALNRRSTQ